MTEDEVRRIIRGEIRRMIRDEELASREIVETRYDWGLQADNRIKETLADHEQVINGLRRFVKALVETK